MQTLEKTAFELELEQSAIAPDLTLNFTKIRGTEAWEYLFYKDCTELRTNAGVLRRKWLKAYSHIDEGGWWCNTLDILEGFRAAWGCFKPNSPRTNKDGKIVKYEHPPTEPTQPFFLELTRDRWERIANLHGVGFPGLSDVPPSTDPFEFWEWVKANPELPIIITEGAKKTASLLSASYCTVGLSGIWNGAPCELAGDGTKLDKKLNPQLEAIATEGREIIFCFDNDTKPKTVASVTKATEATAALFEAHGCDTSVMSWRGVYDEKGIDDIHAAHGSEALDKLFANRLAIADWKKLINKPVLVEKQGAVEATIDEQTVVDVMGAEYKPIAKHLVEKYNEKVEAVTSTPLAPVNPYDPSLDPEEEPAPEAEKPPALTYQEIALQAIYGRGHYLSIQISAQKSDFYTFNGKFYERLKPSLERKKIKAWAEQYWVKDPKTGRKRLKYLTTACINEIYKYALLSFEVELDDCNPKGFNLDNGILRIFWEGNTPKWKLIPHNPKDYFLYCSQVKYDPQADPTHCDTLLQCLDPLPRQVLLRNLAAMFDLPKIRTLHSRPIRAGLCVGRGSNGKDSIRNILGLIFEEQLVSIGLSDFVAYDKGTDKNGVKELKFARINWSSENNQETPLDKIEILNALVTGEKNVLWISDKYMPAERKNSDAIHLFNCNNTPIIKSGLKSLESRFVIYNFDKTFVDHPDPAKGELQADARFHDDPQFQIEQVAPALLNRLLQEFVALAREGIDYSEISKGLKTLQEDSTHLWSFVQDSGLVQDKNGKVWISDLWEKLEEWYLDNGTLEKRELYDGSYKKIWHDQPIRFDANVSGANQVFKRFQKLFPNISKHRETKDLFKKGKFYISGVSFTSASLLHNPHHSNIPDSPTASLPFTNTPSPSLPFSEAKSEDKGEAESLAVTGSEAVKQNLETPKKDIEVPAKYSKVGFLYRIGQTFFHPQTNQYVEIADYPGPGIYFMGQYYDCECSDGEREWIKQSELKELQ